MGWNNLVWITGLFCLFISHHCAGGSSDALVLNGKLTQGSLIRAQLPAGSSVQLNGKPVEMNNQGKFVFGFEREADLSHTLSWTLPDGSEGKREITLTKRDYDIQRIDGLKSTMVTPPDSVTARIRSDSARVASARSKKSAEDGVFSGFIWPAEGPISGVYGSQRILNGEPKWPHYGVDVAGPKGASVVAPAAGVITLAEDLYYSGNTIILDHGMGVFSTFLHLDTMAVKVGDVLDQGASIGTIGETGRATGPHLDWRINLGTQRLDPALLVPDK
ncbi:peptidoglycan DD-metalloendopeptidase family protein [Alteromonas pelagimontana]|uniref:Peptidoglycan DD-metalloendopeptidase family protein n=1 Tax=Alteromonas pelagimontana TaxID=1858656 RepID=A0A6M4MH81_9ALTE|nr:M23 family metallopeptidase [Alteromonas pelagimontana]QJR82564.1 peptidoglycan DD-metalloendopeptidase family protein [Alteromonas pelagimontana]